MSPDLTSAMLSPNITSAWIGSDISLIDGKQNTRIWVMARPRDIEVPAYLAVDMILSLMVIYKIVNFEHKSQES